MCVLCFAFRIVIRFKYVFAYILFVSCRESHTFRVCVYFVIKHLIKNLDAYAQRMGLYNRIDILYV